MIRAAITAVAGYLPENILTNKDLEKMIDTTDEWITTRTGIKERHIENNAEKATSDMAVEAVKLLCKKRGITPEEIDLLIYGTVTTDMVFPATSNIICAKIGGCFPSISFPAAWLRPPAFVRYRRAPASKPRAMIVPSSLRSPRPSQQLSLRKMQCAPPRCR